MPTPSPYQLTTDLQQMRTYFPLLPHSAVPPVPPLNEQLAAAEWQLPVVLSHTDYLPSPQAFLDVSVPAVNHPASIFSPFAGELPAVPQPVIPHPPRMAPCVAQVPSEKSIPPTADQLRDCSQIHIHPDLVAPLPSHPIFFSKVVSTHGELQVSYGISASEDKAGQYHSISATNDGNHPPPNYINGSYPSPSPHHVPPPVMTSHRHSFSVPGQGFYRNDTSPILKMHAHQTEGMHLIGVDVPHPAPQYSYNPLEEGLTSVPPLPKKKRGRPRRSTYPNDLVEKRIGEGRQESRPEECSGQEGLEFGKRFLPKTAIACNFCRLKKLK